MTAATQAYYRAERRTATPMGSIGGSGTSTGCCRTVHGGHAAGTFLNTRRGMQKVPSLVFDMELEEGGCKSTRAEDCEYVGDIVEEVAALVHPRTSFDYQLDMDVRAALQSKHGEVDTAELAQSLSSLGYRAVVRTALGGGCGNACLTNLRHTFLICTPPGSAVRSSTRYIVDTHFRESFEIAKPTARYAAALSAVPAVFVGSQERLAALLNLLCAEMRDAFSARGTVLPPWRQSDSMLSKWQPRRSMDESPSSFASSPTANEQHFTADRRPDSAASSKPPLTGANWLDDAANAIAVAASVSRRSGNGLLSARLEPQRQFFGGEFAAVGRELPAVPALSG